MKKLSKGSEVAAKSQGKGRKSPKGSESPHNLGMTRSIKKPEKKTNSKKSTQMMKCPQVLCAHSDKFRTDNFELGQAAYPSVSNPIMTTAFISNKVPDLPFTLAEAVPAALHWISGDPEVDPSSSLRPSMKYRSPNLLNTKDSVYGSGDNNSHWDADSDEEIKIFDLSLRSQMSRQSYKDEGTFENISNPVWADPRDLQTDFTDEDP